MATAPGRGLVHRPQRAARADLGDAFPRRGGRSRPGVRLRGRRRLGPVGLHRYGDDAEAQIAERTEAARRGIPVTLAALKETAEAG